MTFARTKIQPPRPRSAYVERTLVQARLVDALLNRRVVLLCAPAGYGKTTALAHEIARLPPEHAVAWISADAGDDLQRLLECMLAALEPFDPPWRTAPESLVTRVGHASPEEQRTLAAEIINTLDACEVAHGIIAFEDVHRVDDPAFFAFLDLLIERLSPRWSVAITSRTEPPLALARLLARDELAEFRQLQLQFARDDARRLAAESGLDQAIADRLFDRTQGWPAGMRIAIGVVMAGASAGGSSAPMSHEHVLRAADRPMFDFLVTEVIDKLRPELTDFLLRVNVLPELEASRCAQLADNANAARLLDEIERLGLFVDVLDAPVRTLRLHDLFREALQRRLQLDRPDDWRALLQRAAALEGDPLRKQAMLLAASCFEEAARALLADGTALNISGAVPTTLRLVDAFPADFVAGNAELQRVSGIAKISVWRFQEAERHFVQAEALYAARGDTGAVQSMTARRAQATLALGRLHECAALVESLQRVPLIEVEARLITATATMWLRLERGENRAVAPAFEKLVQLLESCKTVGEWNIIPPPRQTACPGMAAPMLRWGTGALAVTSDGPFPLRAMAHVALAWRAVWLGQLQQAADLHAAAVVDSQWTGHEVILRSHSIALRAVLALLRGDNAEALQCARIRIDEHPAGYGNWGLWQLMYFAARIAAAVGDAPMLRDWLQGLIALRATLTEADPPRLCPLAGLQGVLAELEGRRDEALAHWHDVLAHEEAADLFAQAGEVRIRMAAIALNGGAREAAAALIRPLLQSAGDGPRGAVFAVAALGALARADWSGCLEAAESATLRAWAASLACTPENVGPVATTDASQSVVAATSERLTPREIEVLARIAAGDSNKLIARAFDLSLHTVKRHVAHILDKLDLDSRGQAAAWYRSHFAADPRSATR
jgi:LuxR family transcriptional regulator, maltose regulon positive regulatory protein